MDTKEILSELESLRNSGTKVPGFRGKVMIESDKLAQLAQAIESGMPADIEEAQAIIMQRDSIISQANLEAKRVRDEAENTADSLKSAATETHDFKVSDSEVMKEASNRGDVITTSAATEAQSIIQDAQRKAYAIIGDAENSVSFQREGADRYSREVLSGLEEKLADVLGQVRRGIDTLQAEKAPPSNGSKISA